MDNRPTCCIACGDLETGKPLDLNANILRRENASKTDDNKFPANEEPKVLGHDTVQTKCDHDTNNNTNASEKKPHDNEFTTVGKYKKLLDFDDAPKHLKFNPYIRSGYRTFLSTKLCLQSMFWWTNETVNIWSHLFGYLLFLGLTITDLRFLKTHAELGDQIMVVCLLLCFQMCMLLSSAYHIFSCRSEKHYDLFLSVDFFGISLSLVAIYISGMYYAFWCHPNLRTFYSLVALGMFLLAMVIQVPRFNVSMNAKIAVLLLWSIYGVIPLGHWTMAMGGFQNTLVQLMVPRVATMYLLCGIAFLIYATRIPERWLSGKVDFFGHSHNWWHLFILGAFYHWHNTGIVYAEYRQHHGCSGVGVLT